MGIRATNRWIRAASTWAGCAVVCCALTGCATIGKIENLQGKIAVLKVWWNDYGRDLLNGFEWPNDDLVTPALPPEIGKLDYNGRGWWDKASTYGMNIAGMPPEKRMQVINWRKGDNIAAVALFNEADGPWAGFSCYANNEFAGALDPAKVSHMEAVLKEQKAVTGRLDLWLEVDDSPKSDRAPLSQKIQHADMMIELFDKYATVWTVDLESNEDATLKNDSTMAQLVAHMKTRTNKPVFVHYGRTDASRALRVGADGHHGQTGRDDSPASVGNVTAKAVKVLHPAGKFFVMFESGHSNAKGNVGGEADKARGQAALAHGADGTGSGR